MNNKEENNNLKIVFVVVLGSCFHIMVECNRSEKLQENARILLTVSSEMLSIAY